MACHPAQAVSQQADAVLTHLCFHDGLGRQLVRALRRPPTVDDDTGSSQPISCEDRMPETVLRRLAVVCAAAQPPGSGGTTQGGEETVHWLVDDLAASARAWQAAADGISGDSEQGRECSATLEAALEVRTGSTRRRTGGVKHADALLHTSAWYAYA